MHSVRKSTNICNLNWRTESSKLSPTTYSVDFVNIMGLVFEKKNIDIYVLYISPTGQSRLI